MKTTSVLPNAVNFPVSWRRSRPSLLAATLLAALAIPAATSAQTPDPDALYVLYLRSDATGIDNDAITQMFVDRHFDVTVVWPAKDPLSTAYLATDRIIDLVRMGVSPKRISVIGIGPTSSVAVLTSAIAGRSESSTREVSYVVLGQCDTALKDQYRPYHFRMSGRVLGIHDSADTSAHSCRPLWRDSPKVTDRMQLVTNTGLGAALFDQPRSEWTQPVLNWVQGGSVNVGVLSLQEGAPAKPANRGTVTVAR